MAGNANTLAIINNVETKKVLANVFQFAMVENEAGLLSSGSTILTPAKKIAKSKQANILLPLLNGVKDIREVLIEARDGAISSKEGMLNEAILKLQNEKITEPLFIYPRDGEVIEFADINTRAKGLGVIVASFVNEAFYLSVIKGATDGVAYKVGASGGAIKGKVVESKAVDGTTAQEIKDNGLLFSKQLKRERREIKNIKDKFLQAKVRNSDIVFVINGLKQDILEDDPNYNRYTSQAQAEIKMREWDGDLGGSRVLFTKHLPAHIDFIIMVKGSATSLFALRKRLGIENINLVGAIKMAVSFDEGTGVWLPNMITLGTNNTTTLPEQARVNFDALVTGATASTTEPGSTDEAGLDDSVAPLLKEIEALKAQVLEVKKAAKKEDKPKAKKEDKPKAKK